MAGVLCIGDSLTAGYDGMTNLFRPYAQYLQHMAPDGVKVNEIGVSSRTAAEMVTHANGSLQDGITGKTRPGVAAFLGKHRGEFGLAIIMAGTNDLGGTDNAEEIAENVAKLHQICLDNGVLNTLALSIPDNFATAGSPEYKTRWNKCNQRISVNSNNRHTTFLDMGHIVGPFDKGAGLWAQDGLHFTPKGAALIAQKLVRHFQSRIPAAPRPLPSNPNTEPCIRTGEMDWTNWPGGFAACPNQECRAQFECQDRKRRRNV